MTPRYCRPCDVYWTGPAPCWCCGHPGLDTRADAPWDNPARSWRNAATWTPELEVGA